MYFGLGDENNVGNSMRKPLGKQSALEDRKEGAKNLKFMLRKSVVSLVRWLKLSQDRVHWRSVVDRLIQLSERYLLLYFGFQ
jgi:hypothetical protein